ncbi:Hypothetical protein SCF082_LOCUS16700 [Durusdinium trenchii]|uniref:Ubiquitin-like domain-containing protein n=1 Tax=Durusdinium trenchii TaxID=1381693 RepID=A0ABP0KEU4_9DINO
MTLAWAPKRSTRRRIVCPSRSDRLSLPRLDAAPDGPDADRTRARPVPARPAAPLSVTVRAMYFSNDGSQADTGAQVTLQLSTSSTVEELLNSTREALGGSSRARGRLLFRMRPLKDLEATLEMCGVHRDPSGLHFLMERKHRPQEVVQKAPTLPLVQSWGPGTVALV